MCQRADPRAPDGGVSQWDPVASQREQWTQAYCRHVCDETGHLCEDDDYQLVVRGRPWSDAECMALCTSRIASDPAYIANFHCHAADCAGQWACFDADPRPPDPACERFCVGAMHCGMQEVTEYRGDLDQCTYLCTGQTAQPEWRTQVACLADALDGPKCQIEEALSCFPFREWTCTHVCGGFGHHAACAPGSDYVQTFRDAQTCQTQCLQHSTFEVLAAASCLEQEPCEAGSRCWPPPTEADAACRRYCSETLARCPGFDFPTPALCEAWCTGLARRVEGFPDCLPRSEECTRPQGCPNPTIDCEAACDRVAGCCRLMNEAECLSQCRSASEDLSALEACLFAARSCDGVAACLGTAP